MRQHRDDRRRLQVRPGREPLTQLLEHVQVGLPARVAGVQHQEQQVRLPGRLGRRRDLVGLRPGVGVADRVEQHQPRRDARRLSS